MVGRLALIAWKLTAALVHQFTLVAFHILTHSSSLTAKWHGDQHQAICLTLWATFAYMGYFLYTRVTLIKLVISSLRQSGYYVHFILSFHLLLLFLGRTFCFSYKEHSSFICKEGKIGWEYFSPEGNKVKNMLGIFGISWASLL